MYKYLSVDISPQYPLQLAIAEKGEVTYQGHYPINGTIIAVIQMTLRVSSKLFLMKTRIILIIMTAIIMIGETSCFVRVKARTPRARVRVHTLVAPATNLQQQNAFLPIDLPGDAIGANN